VESGTNPAENATELSPRCCGRGQAMGDGAIGIIIALIGLIAFGGFVKGKWY
jgi:hypothetical protein